MIVEKNVFRDFKAYKKNYKPEDKGKFIKPAVGAALGVATAIAISSKIKKPEKKSIADEVLRMLLMAGLANVGGVLGGSIGSDKQKIKKKWSEAAFQMMNTTIPMLMVSGSLGACEKIKALNKTPIKIIASIAAMASGAAIATGITNATKQDHEPKRKYTIKDSVANFDDMVATVKLGFDKIEKYIPVSKFLPFIYTYCGARAGAKE